ncbi:melanoma-associated antigen 10 isoform X1 [Fukomys damarensis]|uniref:melanoma-associated antigen 10 isoform X1 n=1 Tax=Fukomys damarensis TaxID=885580 RepID=UPI001455ACFB|nr:melanoma-associated antigen 10 isoform X1 [Fukomys damarensis]
MLKTVSRGATPAQQREEARICQESRPLEFWSPSSCPLSITRVIMSGSPKHQLQEDSQDQSTVEEVSAAGTLGPEGGSSPPNAMAATPSSQSHGDSSSEQGEGSSLSQTLPDTMSLISDAIDGKVAELVEFLALKYLMKEPTTKGEMLEIVTKNYQEHFPVIFREVSECMQLVFGIDVKEVDPQSHSYVLVPALGLTYDGMVGDDQSMPKTSLLIIVLGVIFLQGNRASEEVIWEVLNGIGVHAGREHFIYGEPRKFITEDLVREGYLEYRRVPNSDPARYEFLWGPRAHAETSKTKVLEFLAKVNDTTPNAFTLCYGEVLGDEGNRDQLPGPVEG